MNAAAIIIFGLLEIYGAGIPADATVKWLALLNIVIRGIPKVVTMIMAMLTKKKEEKG